MVSKGSSVRVRQRACAQEVPPSLPAQLAERLVLMCTGMELINETPVAVALTTIIPRV